MNLREQIDNLAFKLSTMVWDQTGKYPLQQIPDPLPATWTPYTNSGDRFKGRKVELQGRQFYLCEYIGQKGFEFPWHRDPYAETLISFGHVEIETLKEVIQLKDGQSFTIPAHMPHTCRFLETSHITIHWS